MNSTDGPRGGFTFDPDRDGERLNRQARKVFRVMSDHQWHTLFQISQLTREPEASISARLRDFRKPRFGAHTVERRYVANGLWEYRLLQDDSTAEVPLEVEVSV